MKKRFLAFLLAVSIAVSMLVMPASAAGSNAAVQAAVALGGMTTEQSAQLDLPLTRGQLARLLTAFSSYRESVAAQGSTGTLFSDVNGSSAYGPYIRVAVQQSWLSGYLDGSFRPDNAVTLEEACTAVLKLLGYDVTALSGTFPAAQLNKASSLGLRSSISASQGSTLTLAEGAQLVYNALTASTSDGQVYGSTIGFTVTDGQVDVSSIVMVDLQGPFVAGADTILPFVPASIYRNDSVVSSADLSACDVYYYSESARTLWVYSRKAAGRITAVSPTASAPTAVTVAGTTYTIGSSSAAAALSSLNGGGVGQVVTLLLGMNDEVVSVLTGDEADALLRRGPVLIPQPDRGKWRRRPAGSLRHVYRRHRPHGPCGQEPQLCGRHPRRGVRDRRRRVRRKAGEPLHQRHHQRRCIRPGQHSAGRERRNSGYDFGGCGWDCCSQPTIGGNAFGL